MIILNSFENLIEETELKNKKIYEIAQEEEAQSSEISVEKVRAKVKQNLLAMKSAITAGLKSDKKSSSGLCGNDCKKLVDKYAQNKLLFSKTYQNVILYALATIEQNARMGKMVACPTAGSCGIVPSVIIAISESINADEEAQINALITAGAVGQIISAKMALAGAVAGCQSECGVAAAMASAALVELYNGTNSQIINAVALTLKNIMGLTY